MAEAQGRRFASSSDIDINNLLNDRNSNNTKRATKASVTLLVQYLLENDQNPEIDAYSTSEIAEVLHKFYVYAQKKNGEKYKLSALRSVKWPSHISV